MTVERFKEIMEYNEPDFGYRGEEYSICWPNGVYYVTASDNPQDQEIIGSFRGNPYVKYFRRSI